MPHRCFVILSGTGKTSVAAAVAVGFVHQCRTISPHAKALACAFSNVGADNLAEASMRLGLKVARVGKPSAVSESLWECTLDAAIHRDPDAQKAMESATRATAQLSKLNKRLGKASSMLSDQTIRDAATAAVKASIEVCLLLRRRLLEFNKGFRDLTFVVFVMLCRLVMLQLRSFFAQSM